MSVRKTVSVFLLAALCVTASVFTGCRGKAGAEGADSFLTLEVFDVAANLQGIQPGWFGKLIKDKFNIEMNIIAPNVQGGKTLYQTRSSAGNLGDLVILDNADFEDCIKSGLILDLTSYIDKYPNLMVFDRQIKAYNNGIAAAKGKIYGIPSDMTTTSPTAYTPLYLYSSTWLPWDYFSEIGAPELKDTDDLIDALEKMQKAHPINSAGDRAYGISLWPDWDNTGGIENVIQTLKWHGVEVAGGTSSVLLDTNGNMTPTTDDSGAYLKQLKFFFNANQRGIVDPDSGTQQWDQIVVKMQNKRIYLWWYSWQQGFWNNNARASKRENFSPIPVDDLYYFQDGDSYFGDGRVWGIGSKVSAAKRDRILAFIDWLAGPEGAEAQWSGIKDFTYKVRPDGQYEMTPEGEVRFSQNPPVPAEWGGGGWNDGNHWLNKEICQDISTNPRTGYPYLEALWPVEIEKAKTVQSREWVARYGAENQVAYLRAHNQLGIVPRVNVSLPSDSTDIALIRGQCGELLRDTSWKMIFAKSEAEFNKLWADMKAQLAGFGWDKLYQYDKQRFQAVVDARAAALK